MADQITILKLRNVAYQKEHTNLRNAITVVKFQIEKIKESIEKAKVKELKDLEEFEKSVDQITAKFRSGLEIYVSDSINLGLKCLTSHNFLLDRLFFNFYVPPLLFGISLSFQRSNVSNFFRNYIPSFRSFFLN